MMSYSDDSWDSRPPLLTESNYLYWRARMRAFITPLHDRAWAAVLEEWKPPVIKKTIGDEVIYEKKRMADWTEEENTACTGNAKALYAIFCAVPDERFWLIANCKTAKQPWDTLETHYNGTWIRASKLRELASRFRVLKMGEDETIAKFEIELKDIANLASQLGEVYDDEKLVRKTMRSLPKRFAAIVAAIRQEKDITQMRLDELLELLKVYEIDLDFWKNVKGSALQDVKKKSREEKRREEKSREEEEDDEEMALIRRNFTKMLKSSQNNRGGKSREGKFNSKFHDKRKETDKLKKSVKINKSIQCYECKGYGHIRAECINTLRKRGKSRCKTWSDTESEEEEGTTNFLCLNAVKKESGSVEETIETRPA